MKLFLGTFFLVFTIRSCWIYYGASPLPFWDEWYAIVAWLFGDWFDGKLSLQSFLVPGNEHYLFFTKIIHFVFFWLQKQKANFFPVIYFQSIFPSLNAAFLIWLINKNGKRVYESLLILFLFTWPLSFENLLWAYQSHVYIQTSFFLLAAYWLSHKDYNFPLLILLIFLSALNMATALAIPLLAIFTNSLYYLQSKEKKYIFRSAALFAVAITIYLCIPKVSHHEALKSSNLIEFLISLSQYILWPGYLGLFFVLLPFGFLVFQIYKTRDLEFKKMFPLLLYCLFYLVICFAAFGRKGTISNRYFDYLLFLLIASVFCVRDLLAPFKGKWADVRWVFLLFFLLNIPFFKSSLTALEEWKNRLSIIRHQITHAYRQEIETPGNGEKYLSTQPPLAYPENEGISKILFTPNGMFLFRYLNINPNVVLDNPRKKLEP